MTYNDLNQTHRAGWINSTALVHGITEAQARERFLQILKQRHPKAYIPSLNAYRPPA